MGAIGAKDYSRGLTPPVARFLNIRKEVKPHKSTVMDYVLLLITFAGALISELLSIYADMIGCKTFLKKLIPNKSERFYFIFDALLMPFIGTALAYFIMEPTSMKTAFCAGLTWCGTLQTLGLTLKSETVTTTKTNGDKTTVSTTTKTTKKV